MHGVEWFAKVDEEVAVVDANAVRDEIEPQHRSFSSVFFCATTTKAFTVVLLSGIHSGSLAIT